MRDTGPAKTLRPGRFRWVLLAIAAAIAALWLMLIAWTPSVPDRSRPTAQTIEAGRSAIRQLREAQTPGDETGATVRFDNDMLAGVAALLTDTGRVGRVDARVQGAALTIRSSYPLPLGQWLNSRILVESSRKGFPQLRVTIGHLPLPGPVGRWAAESGLKLLRARGAQLPPLDRMVRSVGFEQGTVVARLNLPERTRLVQQAVQSGGATIDAKLVAGIYCGLVRADLRRPEDQLSMQLRRAFAPTAMAVPEEYNRAALVALALYTVGERAEAVAGAAVKPAYRCGAPAADRIALLGRADLAKHWTLSAALAAVLGDGAAGAIGEWKELADSLPRGSGFSFLDLAADRSGVLTARRAVDPALAEVTARRLARADDARLIPEELREGPEGLSETEFAERYGAIDSGTYRRAVAQIDRALTAANPA